MKRKSLSNVRSTLRRIRNLSKKISANKVSEKTYKSIFSHTIKDFDHIKGALESLGFDYKDAKLDTSRTITGDDGYKDYTEDKTRHMANLFSKKLFDKEGNWGVIFIMIEYDVTFKQSEDRIEYGELVYDNAYAEVVLRRDEFIFGDDITLGEITYGPRFDTWVQKAN